MYSVIIPAHNEEAVIGRCLQSLTQGDAANLLEIVVVCNGCNDRTAEIAQAFSNVRVISTPTASKIAALNLGDAETNYFPVAYVDADIVVTSADLVKAFKVLDEGKFLIVAPELHVDLSGASSIVKAFYSVWMDLPYFKTGKMVGSGIYMLSEVGRKRFGEFPQIISDDGYVRSLFSDDERSSVKGTKFFIFSPKTVASLIKIKTRVRLGNMESAAKHKNTPSQVGGENSFKDMVAIALKQPWRIFQLAAYVYVQLATKHHSNKKMQEKNFSTWERDESSRT